LVVVAAAYFYRLDRPLLWGDEADTGIESRNTLRYGYPVAYDGRNVSVLENGAQLNRELVCKKIPWSQYYVGALSLALFGNDTAGLRALFAVIGLLAFLPVYAVLKTRVRSPEFIAALVMMAPQTVLFQRNARYYSILILLYAALIWQLSAKMKSPKTRLLVASLVFVLLFHTHPVAAACCGLSLILFCRCFRREALSAYLLASGIGFISWLLWYKMLGPPLGETARPPSLLTSDFPAGLKAFFTGLWATLVDLDAVNCVPMLLWFAALALLFWRGRKAVLGILQDPIPVFVLVNLLVQAVASAAVFGSESVFNYSFLRYMPHLLVFGMVSCFIVLDAAIRSRGLYLLVCAFAVGFNLLTFSFWAKPFSRKVPVSWFLPVYSEIVCPPQDTWDAVFSGMRNESDDASGRDTVIVALPPWTRDVVIFYLGDRYLVCPTLDESAKACVPLIRKVIGEESFRRLSAKPEWLIDTYGFLRAIPDGYATAAVIPSYRARPDDGTRPELNRHTFSQSAVATNAVLFRLERK